MKFGKTQVPQSLFELARTRLQKEASCTTDDARSYVLKHGVNDLNAITAIETNQCIVANRVVRAVIDELRAAGEIAQLKRGVWAKTTFLNAAHAQEDNQ